MSISQIRILMLVTAVAVASGCRHPRDADLVQRFISHKVEFEELLNLFQHDQDYLQIAKTFTHPRAVVGNSGLSRERWKLYQYHFDKLEINGVLRRDDGSVVLFTATALGLLTKGS